MVVRIAVAILACISLFKNLNADEKAVMHASSSTNTSAVRGRLRDGQTDLPIGGAYVFAVTEDGKTVLGQAVTYAKTGSDLGYYEITGLPAGVKVTLVAFHPDMKFNLAVEDVQLKSGEFVDVYGLETYVAVPNPSGIEDASGWLGLISLISHISSEADEIRRSADAEKRVTYLLDKVRTQCKEAAARKKQSPESICLSLADVYEDTTKVTDSKSERGYLSFTDGRSAANASLQQNASRILQIRSSLNSVQASITTNNDSSLTAFMNDFTSWANNATNHLSNVQNLTADSVQSWLDTANSIVQEGQELEARANSLQITSSQNTQSILTGSTRTTSTQSAASILSAAGGYRSMSSKTEKQSGVYQKVEGVFVNKGFEEVWKGVEK